MQKMVFALEKMKFSQNKCDMFHCEEGILFNICSTDCVTMVIR